MAAVTAQRASSSRCSYDVFLSFRGKDTRHTFTDHLYRALVHAGVRTFRDDDEVERGENLASELTKAIQESRISVIIFSADYASSSWCLDELLVILERKRTAGHTIFPVFYYVDPSQVRQQSGSFAKSFVIHEEQLKAETEEGKEEGMDKIKRWKEALKEVANLAGLALKDGYESKFIKKIIKEIHNKLNQTALSVATYPIGISSLVEDINFWLRDRSTDVSIMTIFGISGTGKSNLVKTVYDLNFNRFEGSSFLANIRETAAQPNGLFRLQKRLLSNILKGKIEEMSSFDEGVIKIKDATRDKRVLLVFDDVDELHQYNVIQKVRHWFYPGSKIIITTRNRQLLQADLLYKMHKVEKLKAEDYREYSKRVAKYCRGIPLFLQVLGYSGFGDNQKDTHVVSEADNIEALAIESDEFSCEQDKHEQALKNIDLATNSVKTGHESFFAINGRGSQRGGFYQQGVFKRGNTRSMRAKSRLTSRSHKPFSDVNEDSDNRNGVTSRHHSKRSQSKYEGISENPMVHNMPRDKRCSVVQNNSIRGKLKMALEFFEPESRGLRPLVNPPSEVADEEGCADWHKCLVGYFIDTPRRLSYQGVNTIAHELWGSKGLIDVFDNDRGCFFFRFSTEQESEAVLKCGPWHFGYCHLVIEKWHMGMNLSIDRVNKIPIWLKLYNIPLEFWNAKGLSYIASAVGKPLYADALTESRTRLSFAHICVEIQAGTDLVEEFDLRINDSDLIPIKAEYEWKPLSCSKCKVFGHSTQACSINLTTCSPKQWQTWQYIYFFFFFSFFFFISFYFFSCDKE